MILQKSYLLSALLPLAFLSVAAEDCEGDDSDCPQCVADFAIYDPSYENDGVWEEEVTALLAMFEAYNFTYEIVDHRAINNGQLGTGENKRYRALIAPGGWAYFRSLAVDETGDAAILDFVSSGGNYVGFCAGTFWAADDVVWAEEATGGEGSYYQASDYITYDYDLNLWPGDAQGPFSWSPWLGGYNPSLEPVAINQNSPTMTAIGMPENTRFFYYGGPFFTFDTPPDNLDIWAYATKPPEAPEGALIGDGEAAVIHYTMGSGNVVLFSHHPEVLIDSDTDNLTLSQAVAEGDYDWNTGELTQDQINLDSWNIVHAALQIAANESVSPVTSLP